MTIRLKMLLTYAAMLVIPLVFMIMTALLLVYVYQGDLQTIHRAYGSSEMLMHERQSERFFKELKRTVERSPELLTQTDYLTDLDNELGKSRSGIIVRLSGKITYVSGRIDKPEIVDRLPAFEHPGYREGERNVKSGNEMFAMVQFDFQTGNGQSGSLFLVEAVNPVAEFARKFFPILFGSLLFILILTHTALTYFVSKSIIRPLKLLKKAATQIKEGSLDIRVEVAGKDEIGQLGVAFEEMRQQLQESVAKQLQYEENRKELVSNISHDLKTPLTAIKGYVEGIQDGVADTPEKMDKYIKTIYTKADEMNQLIEELFLFSKLDLKRLPFNFEAVDIRSFLQDCSEEMRFDLEKKGFRFQSDIEVPSETLVSVDRDKLKRAVINIIDNCVKYCDSAKAENRIRFRARKDEGSVLIEIADNGSGIEPEALQHIFERFYRAEKSRNSKTGGSGLGLAIAKQIVEGHNGRIEARSTFGEGTAVRMILPIRITAYGESHENHLNH